MTEIWFLRHGESRAQTEEELSIDAGLSTAGYCQAQLAGEKLRDIQFDEVRVSPLRRAWESFLALERPETPLIDVRMVENMPPGGYSGLLPYRYPAGGETVSAEAWEWLPEERVGSLICEFRRKSESRILMVGHGMFFTVFAGALGIGEDEAWHRLRLDNGAVRLLIFDNTGQTVSMSENV